MGLCDSNAKNYSDKLEILDIRLPDIASNLHLQLHKYPKHNFIVRENIEIEETDHSKRRYIRFDADQADFVELSFPVYDYLSKSLIQQLGNIKIQEVFIDNANAEHCLFLVQRDEVLSSLAIRTFPSFDSEQMYRIANEIYTAQRIALLKSEHLHKITHSFTIMPTNELISHYSQLIFMQPVTISLSMLIRNRRASKMPWTIGQFVDLMTQILQGLNVLHKNWFAHNDIRLSNIFYCQSTKRYFLSGFSHVKVISDIIPTLHNEESGIHSNSLLRSRRLAQAQKDYIKADIYDLGLSLLNAFFLHQPIDRKKCAPYIRELSHHYPILHIIKDMIADHDERASIAHIKSTLQQYSQQLQRQDVTLPFDYDQQLLQINMEAYRKEILVAEGYKRLGVLQSWKKKLHQHHLHGIIAEQTLESAKYFEQLAILSDVEGNTTKCRSYYVRAAEIYHLLGTKQFKERQYMKAIMYLENAMNCLGKVKEDTVSLPYLKVKLSLFEAKILSGTQIISFYTLQELQAQFRQIYAKDGDGTYECMEQFVNIYGYYQNYPKMQSLLSEVERQCRKLNTAAFWLNLQMKIILNNIQLIAVSHKPEAEQLIKQTYDRINRIKNEKEYFLIENPIYKLKIERLETRFEASQHKPGSLQRLFELLPQLTGWRKHFQVNDQHTHCFEVSILQAEVLEEIGDLQASNHNDDEAYQYYSRAFQTYRDTFGSMYNIECGLLAEKLGQIQKAKGNRAQYDGCIQLFSKIMKCSYGLNHKHWLRLKEVLERSPKKLKTRTSIAFGSSQIV